MNYFYNKTIWITGASSGIGEALAIELSKLDANLILTARRKEELERVKKACGNKNVAIFPCDLEQIDEIDDLSRKVQSEFPEIDILINNAGVNIPQPIDEVKDETWDQVIEINLTSIMRLTRALVPAMKKQKWGRIVHISSVLGVGSKPARNAYSATKASLLGLAKASALDLGPFGITVNCIGPGPFLTDMPMSLLSDSEKDEFSRATALGRWGEPRELAGPALLLASEAGSYITGEMLLVDGGAFARAL